MEEETYTPKARVKKPAPDFRAMAWDVNRFKEISLKNYRGKYVVLFFFPLDFTFVCPTEIISFNDTAPEFRANECEILACSVDSHFAHREYTMKARDNGGLGKMQIPMISDIGKHIGKDYGVYLDFSEDMGVNLRATFIIDREGILRHMSVNDLPVGRNIREILRLVQAFQYTDVYGEVCPESWTPGSATMVADHDSDKLEEYWKQEHAGGEGGH